MVLKRLIAAFVAIALVLAACSTPVDLQVTSFSPAEGATNVAIDAVVTATFNVAIDVDTVEGNFELASAGGAVAGDLAYDATTRTATFTPDLPLAYSTLYTVTVDGSVATTGGVALGGDASWSFTTEASPIVDAIGGLDVTPTSAGLLVGASVQLDAELTGVVGTPDLSISWSSGNEAVATVDADGLVTAVAAGTAVITATSDFDDTVSDSATITVSPVPTVVSVSVTPASPTILFGDTVQLTADVLAIGGADEGVSWSSDDESVATVSATGLVTAEGEGTASITATSDFDGDVSGSATVTVTPWSIGSVVVTPETAALIVGETVQLEAALADVVGTPDLGITWSSDDESVATVDADGLVTAEGEGTASITATSDFDGAVTDSATLTVFTALAGDAYADGGVLVDTELAALTPVVSGGATPYAFATADALPAGVTLDAVTGAIAGTPTEIGTFAGVVTATDAIGQEVDLDFSIDVVDVLTVTPFLDATEGAGTTIAPLSVVTTGGLAPFTFEIVAPEPFPAPNGPLAPGLDFDETTGTISGTLSLAGFFSSEILTTDALGQTATTLVEIDVALVLEYTGNPYSYPLGCGGVGTVALCPAVTVDEPAQGNFGAITPESDIVVTGATGPLLFSMVRVGGGSTTGWAIAPGRGVIFRSDAANSGGFSNTGATRNGNRSYLVTVFDDGSGETATFTVDFLVVP